MSQEISANTEETAKATEEHKEPEKRIGCNHYKRRAKFVVSMMSLANYCSL